VSIFGVLLAEAFMKTCKDQTLWLNNLQHQRREIFF